MAKKDMRKVVVVGAWESCRTQVWIGYKLGEKLKVVKRKFKQWKMEVYEDIN